MLSVYACICVTCNTYIQNNLETINKRLKITDDRTPEEPQKDDDNGEAAEEGISAIKTKAKQLKRQWAGNLDDTISRCKAFEGNEYLIINFSLVK